MPLGSSKNFTALIIGSLCSVIFYLYYWWDRHFMLYRLRVNDFILRLSLFFINIGHPYTFVIFRGVHITEFLVTFFFPFYLIFWGIAIVDEVHDFVDVLVGEVFFAKAGVSSER